MKSNIVVGLDIGTTKVCCVIAEKENNQLNVIGTGVVPSEGMSRGLIANIAMSSKAIKEAVDKASEQAQVKVTELNIGVAGEHIQSLRHHSYVIITSEDDEITQEDVNRLEEDVRKLKSSSNMEILHILPEKYIVDGNEDVINPVGMVGRKLEADHHVVLASIPAVANLERAVQKAGFSVKSRILQPLASSYSVLEADEKELGVILIDIGGGTTDVAVFHGGTIKFSGIIGIAGSQITRNLSSLFGIVKEEAERIKVDYGYAFPKAIVKDEKFYIKGVGARKTRELQMSELSEYIYPQMKELFEYIDSKLLQAKVKRFARTGVVITGGGSLMKGITDLATEVFNLPSHLGIPMNVVSETNTEISRPEFATALGLIQNVPAIATEKSFGKLQKKKDSKISKVIKKVKEIFNEL